MRIERKIVRSLVSARNTFCIVPANYVGMYYTRQCDLNSSKGFAAEKSDKSFLSVPFDDFEPCNSYYFASAIHSSFQLPVLSNLRAGKSKRATLFVIFNDLLFPHSLSLARSLSLRARQEGGGDLEY